MALKATTVRFDEVSLDVVKAEARLAGVSTAQFVRESALIRAFMRAAARKYNLRDGEIAAFIDECAAKVVELSRVD